jgi:hypothetical protein
MRSEHPDIAAALDDIEAIIHAPLEEYRSLGERAGAYAALQELSDYLRERLQEREVLGGYAAEKITKVAIHGAGMLGFGERRKLDAQQERVFAMADLSVLRSVLIDALGAD